VERVEGGVFDPGCIVILSAAKNLSVVREAARDPSEYLGMSSDVTEI
jgi:hypothetical protein